MPQTVEIPFTKNIHLSLNSVIILLNSTVVTLTQIVNACHVNNATIVTCQKLKIRIKNTGHLSIDAFVSKLPVPHNTDCETLPYKQRNRIDHSIVLFFAFLLLLLDTDC